MKETTIQSILDNTESTPKQKVESLTNLAYAAIAEAEVIAESNQFNFSFDLAYGMGGTYGEDWDASSDEEGQTPYTWNASSQSC